LYDDLVLRDAGFDSQVGPGVDVSEELDAFRLDVMVGVDCNLTVWLLWSDCGGGGHHGARVDPHTVRILLVVDAGKVLTNSLVLNYRLRFEAD